MKRFYAPIIIALLAVSVSVYGADRVTTAKELLEEGKVDEALQELRRAVELNPKHSEAVYWLGIAYFEAGKLDSAIIAGETYVNQKGKEPDGYVLVAKIHIKQENYAEADKILAKGLKSLKDDSNPKLLIQVGNMHMAQGNTNEAIVTYAQAKERDPQNTEIIEKLGDAYLKLGTEAMAIIQYEKALELDENRVSPRQKLAELYLRDKRWNDAAQMYLKVLEKNPSNDVAALEVSKIYMLAKQYANVAIHIEPYVNRHPEDNKTWLMFLEALMGSRQYGKAIDAAKHILGTDPKSAKALAAAGKSSFYNKNYNESIDYYRKLEELNAMEADDAKFLGTAYLANKPRSDSLAILYLEKSLELDSTQIEIFRNLGDAYMRKQQWDKAANMYAKKIESDSTYVTAFINYALCKMVLKEWDDAKSALHRALKMQPEYLKGHLYMARVYASIDSAREARWKYETVAQLADTAITDNAEELKESYRFIIISYLQDKNWTKSVEFLDKALVISPNDAELRLWRAQTLHAMNRIDEAKAEYQRVLRIDPGNKDAKKGLDLIEYYGN